MLHALSLGQRGLACAEDRSPATRQAVHTAVCELWEALVTDRRQIGIFETGCCAACGERLYRKARPLAQQDTVVMRGGVVREPMPEMLAGRVS